MTEALSAGSRVGVYEVQDRLGSGGMGVVYRARDTRLGRTVALKVLRGDDPELLRRLDREARAASALNHPNIVHIYDVGVAAGEAGAHFVAMEYVEGETLRRRLARGALQMTELLDLGAQLADGLAKAHRAGIVHRDLKPENLVVTPDGLVKILDFGLAKLAPPPLAELEGKETLTRHATQAGTLLGTLEYMSPEQASGRPVDHRTDQFALGLLLYEMASGSPVFRRDTPAQVLAAVIEREAEPLRTQRADAPDSLERLVARCLQKDPARRFARTDEIAAELATLAGRSRSAGLVSTPPAPPPLPRPAAVSAEVVGVPAGGSGLYHVQVGDQGKDVRTYDEEQLADRIRVGRLTGVELVRRDGDDRWLPLFETQVFRREVPTRGNPEDAARWRALRALGGHFTGFFIVGVVMLSTQGNLPFWMGIWGAVLGLQVLRALPTIAPLLWRSRPQPEVTVAPAPVQLPPPLPQPARASGGPTAALAQEADRVRALIQQRGGRDAARLIAEVDDIVRRTGELATREADLEDQTSESERAVLVRATAEAEARLERATLAQDRNLFARELEVLKRRQESIDKALRVLARLRVRRELAGHQLKQLRLDLSRGAAVALDVPELSSRLQFIRHEVDAREEVDEIDAATD